MNVADLIRPVRRWAGRIEAWEVARFGRSGLSVLFRRPVLVLHTTGRRSGRERRTPLAYRELDGAYVVVGGAGGQTAVPDWVLNVRSEPAVRLTVDRRSCAAVATELHGVERQAMWDRLLPEMPVIAKYERRAGRPIPVLVLHPVER